MSCFKIFNPNKPKIIDLAIKLVNDNFIDEYYLYNDVDKLHEKLLIQRFLENDGLCFGQFLIKIIKNKEYEQPLDIVFLEKFVVFLDYINVIDVSLSDIEKINKKINEAGLNFTINPELFVKAFNYAKKFELIDIIVIPEIYKFLIKQNENY